MLSEMAFAPASFTFCRLSLFNRGVPLGDTAVASPISEPYLTNSNKSGRLKGSPPVKMKIGDGFPNDIACSNKRFASAVDSESGCKNGCDSARQ